MAKQYEDDFIFFSKYELQDVQDTIDDLRNQAVVFGVQDKFNNLEKIADEIEQRFEYDKSFQQNNGRSSFRKWERNRNQLNEDYFNFKVQSKKLYDEINKNIIQGVSSGLIKTRKGGSVKTCNICGLSKPLAQFVKDKRYKDGHSNVCKNDSNKRARVIYNRKQCKQHNKCKVELENLQEFDEFYKKKSKPVVKHEVELRQRLNENNKNLIYGTVQLYTDKEKKLIWSDNAERKNVSNEIFSMKDVYNMKGEKIVLEPGFRYNVIELIADFDSKRRLVIDKMVVKNKKQILF